MSDASNGGIVPVQPPRESEWVIRYRVLGPSAVWDGMTVCEVVTGPQAGEKKVLDIEDFTNRLHRVRRSRGT